MARPKSSDLPRFLSFHPPNHTYYYKNPGMLRKANLGKDTEHAVQIAAALNRTYAIETERAARHVESAIDLGSPSFELAFTRFVDKYCADYRLKSSTRTLLAQRRQRLASRIGDLQLPLISTQVLREAVETDSSFEQAKVRAILRRFFQFAKSCGDYPQHLPNPVDDLYVDPSPAKRRQRMTIAQFRSIHEAAPEWLRTMTTLGLHLALRRVDLVNLRFDDIVGDRVVSPIRKTDTEARTIEATSVSFPIHPSVRKAIAAARECSLRNGRCPFVVHRVPQRRTSRLEEALTAGRMQHSAQVLPEYASKAFAEARRSAILNTTYFDGISPKHLPTLHEIRSLSSHLYARSGYTTREVQDLMAHTDPDMTRAYQRGHARKLLRVEMMLPTNLFEVGGEDNIEPDPSVRERRPAYRVPMPSIADEKAPRRA